MTLCFYYLCLKCFSYSCCQFYITLYILQYMLPPFEGFPEHLTTHFHHPERIGPFPFCPLRLCIDCFHRMYVRFFFFHIFSFYIYASLLLPYYNSLRAGPFPFSSVEPDCPFQSMRCMFCVILYLDASLKPTRI